MDFERVGEKEREEGNEMRGKCKMNKSEVAECVRYVSIDTIALSTHRHRLTVPLDQYFYRTLLVVCGIYGGCRLRRCQRMVLRGRDVTEFDPIHVDSSHRVQYYPHSAVDGGSGR
jgi:hypothetical protein